LAEGDYKFDPQTQFSNPDSYFIKLDKRWRLDELSEFSKNYEQSYYAAFALVALRTDSSLGPDTQGRLLSQMARYPWKGGVSTVHFYYGVKRIVGRKRQPEIRKIKYSSPGFIELSTIQDVALSLGAILASICGSVTMINGTYNRIYKGLRERELNEISVEKARLDLVQEHRDFLRHSIDDMGQHLGLDDQERLIEASGNEFRALKILLSMYRRIRILARFQDDRKVLLPKQKSENSIETDTLNK
jgi:hypothetical protein